MFDGRSDDVAIPRHVQARFAQLAARCRDHRQDLDPTARPELLELAAGCAAHYPVVAEDALAILARDCDPTTRDGATLGLQKLLALLGGLARLRLTIDWATAADGNQRVVLSRALATDLHLLGAVSVLDVLVGDARAEVRQAACVSCGARLATSPMALAALLTSCVADVDPAVRSAALAGLELARGIDAGRVP